MVEYFGPRALVLDGQSVSRDTDPEYRPQNVNKEVNTQTSYFIFSFFIFFIFSFFHVF